MCHHDIWNLQKRIRSRFCAITNDYRICDAKKRQSQNFLTEDHYRVKLNWIKSNLKVGIFYSKLSWRIFFWNEHKEMWRSKREEKVFWKKSFFYFFSVQLRTWCLSVSVITFWAKHKQYFLFRDVHIHFRERINFIVCGWRSSGQSGWFVIHYSKFNSHRW